MLRAWIAVLAVLTASACARAYGEDDTAFPPHRIADHLYYVGTRQLATYLITTSQGHILVNSGFEKTVPLIRNSVERLGFKMSDVKILLASHAHDDHVAGLAALQKITGAKVEIMKGDAEVIAQGGVGQYRYDTRWPVCHVDRVLKDGDTVTLGEVTLTAHLTPGHTRGCTTWTFPISDGGTTLAAVIVGSPNVNPGYRLVDNASYPEIARDYVRTFAVLESLPCDLFLGAHGAYYDLDRKYPALAKLKAGGKNPFIDPAGYRAYVADRKKVFEETLATQTRASPAAPPAH